MTIKNQIEYERERDEWRNLIGKTMVSFGDIEYFTVKCLAHIPSDKISDTALDLPFRRRVDLLVKVIKARHKASAPAAEFVKMLREAKKLAQVRNVIAHNPLMLDICVNNSTGDVATELAIRATRSKKPKLIDLASIKECAARVEDLVSELYSTYGRLEQP